jgi:hypothetical protein
MDILIAVVIICTFFIGALIVVTLHARQMSARRALPLRSLYLQQHSTADCTRCAASEQREFGLDDSQDRKRIVACAACGKELFQFVRDEATA